MRRRTLLSVGTLTLVGVAGCLDQVISGGTDDEDVASTARADEVETLMTVSADEETEPLLTYGDVADVGSVSTTDEPGPQLPVSLTDGATATVLETLESLGAFEDPESIEFNLYYDDSVVGQHQLGPALADTMAADEWDGNFLLMAENEETLANIETAITGESRD